MMSGGGGSSTIAAAAKRTARPEYRFLEDSEDEEEIDPNDPDGTAGWEVASD